MENGMSRSGGRETFWTLAGLLAVEAAFTIYLNSDVGLQIFKAAVMPIATLGMAVLGYQKLGGIWAAKR